MSLVPLFFRDWWDDLETTRPTSRLLDQNFGMGINRDDLLSSIAVPSRSLLRANSGYYRPWGSLLNRQNSSSTINVDKEKFEVTLDVQQFTPSEITVKVTNETNTIVVEGKHEEKQDEHGYISRHFVRRYVIPQGHDLNGVVSSLSSDGVLTVTVPKKSLPVAQGERVIPIKQVPAKNDNQMKIDEPN